MKNRNVLAALLAAGIAFAAPASAAVFEPSLDQIFQVDASELISGGQFFATASGPVSLTYLGAYAAHTDYLHASTSTDAWGPVFQNNPSATDHTSNHPGDMVSLGNLSAGTEIKFNLVNANNGNLWASGAASQNSDDMFHTKTWYNADEGYALVGFEDLSKSQGADWDYNDLVFRVNNVSVTPVPEPTTLAMVAGGVGVLVARARRKKSA